VCMPGSRLPARDVLLGASSALLVDLWVEAANREVLPLRRGFGQCLSGTGEAPILDVRPEAVGVGHVCRFGAFVRLVGCGEDLEDVARHRLLAALLRLL
jgi:hypothetical protein